MVAIYFGRKTFGKSTGSLVGGWRCTSH
jgi:hypothetical protein